MALFEKFELAKKEESVMSWWKSHKKSLPLLANFARRILGIPVSSGKSERVFSTGGNFVKEKRTRLNAKKVQSLITIKENREQVELYLLGKAGNKLETDNVENAFEKIKVVTRIGILSEDVEISSDEEYFMDDD